MFLRHPEVAGLVVDALPRGVERGYYDVRAFLVMGNHVPVLEHNPVQAGLAADPAHYRWSSAWQGGELKFAALESLHFSAQGW
jgi:hypothetical protein